MWLISSWLFAFMLFNFQGPVRFVHRSELVYYITLFSACQAPFQSFLISFWNRSFNRNRLFLAYLWAFWALVCRCLADSSYIISCPNCFVNTFFEKIRIFFKKVGNPLFFPLLCGFSSFSGTLQFWVFLSKNKIALCLQLFSLLFLILYAIMNELFLLCARSSVG